MSEPEFPIYCKSQNGARAFMILSEKQVLTITNSQNEISIAIIQFDMIDDNILDAWKAGELVESNAKDFHFQRIETNNRLISIGVSKKAQPQKSNS